MERQEIIDLLPAYALDVLDADEQQVVEAALTADPGLRAMLDEYSGLAVGLATNVAAVEPPSGHRQRMMARLQGTTLLAATQTLPQQLASRDYYRAAETQQPPRPDERGLANPRPLRTIFSFAALAAAALVIVSLLGWNVALQNEIGNNNTSVANLSSQLTRIQAQLGQAKQEVAGLQGQITQAKGDNATLTSQLTAAQQSVSSLQGANELLAQRGTVVREVAAKDQPLTSQFIANPNSNKGVVLAYNLAPVPSGKTYELWVIGKDGKPLPAGTFDPDAKGQAVHNLTFSGSLADYAAVGITVEPTGGSPTPSGAPIAVGNI